MSKHLDEAERLLLKASEYKSGGVLYGEYVEHAVLELTRHLRSTAEAPREGVVGCPECPEAAAEARRAGMPAKCRGCSLYIHPPREEQQPGEPPSPNPKTMAELHACIAWLVSNGYEPERVPVDSRLRATLFLSGRAWQVDDNWFIGATRPRSGKFGEYAINITGAELRKAIEAMAVVPLSEEQPPGEVNPGSTAGTWLNGKFVLEREPSDGDLEAIAREASSEFGGSEPHVRRELWLAGYEAAQRDAATASKITKGKPPGEAGQRCVATGEQDPGIVVVRLVLELVRRRRERARAAQA